VEPDTALATDGGHAGQVVDDAEIGRPGRGRNGEDAGTAVRRKGLATKQPPAPAGSSARSAIQRSASFSAKTAPEDSSQLPP
jgi:hypothetical protein